MYLLLLAQAERGLGNGRQAIAHLLQARELGDMGHPLIYQRVLLTLQDIYWDHGHYLKAFKVKQDRLEVEKAAGIRAFVGAGRLGRDRRITETSDEIPLEIRASGRQQDLEALLQRIGRNDYKLIVLHGLSGVGKSSLVNAGLIPRLKKKPIGFRDNLVVLQRQYQDWHPNLALAFTESLRRFAHRVNPDNPTAPLPPIPPDRLIEELQQTEDRFLRVILIFDQFEEFFFANPDPLERRRFFEFVGTCLQIPFVKVVLSLREDYIHYLLECARLSSIQETGIDVLSREVRYSLGNLTPANTRAVIHDLTENSRYSLEPALIDALVVDLAGELQEVRPIEMQIVGAQLQTEGIKTLAAYRDRGENPKQELVKGYLAEVVHDCGETLQPIAELILYLLTDERGTRPLKTRSQLLQEIQTLGVVLESEVPSSPNPFSPGRRGEELETPPSPSRVDLLAVEK